MAFYVFNARNNFLHFRKLVSKGVNFQIVFFILDHFKIAAAGSRNAARWDSFSTRYCRRHPHCHFFRLFFMTKEQKNFPRAIIAGHKYTLIYRYFFRFKVPSASIKVILKMNRLEIRFYNPNCQEWPKCDDFHKFSQIWFSIGLL